MAAADEATADEAAAEEAMGEEAVMEELLTAGEAARDENDEDQDVTTEGAEHRIGDD